MRPLRRFAIGLVAGVAIAAVIVGHAPPSDGATLAPTPITHKATDPGVLTIVVEAPARVWGLRKVAAYIDQRVNGIDVWARRGFVCDPDVTCIRVTMQNFNGVNCGALNAWFGCADVGGNDPVIWLNTFYRKVPTVACHEFLHTLGLDHHDGQGCLGNDPTPLPSATEMQMLQAMYP